MFLGEFRHSLDTKDRLTVPVRFREELASGAYLVLGFDNNLMVLTDKAFQIVSERIIHKSITDPLARDLRRSIFRTANFVEIDKAGRILIPEYLRQLVGLDGEVMLVGQYDYFEIWDPDAWQRYQDGHLQTDANAERFKALDITTSAD